MLLLFLVLQLFLLQPPDSAGAATLTFRDTDPFDEFVVADASAIVADMIVEVTSGTGQLPVWRNCIKC